jgi:anti-sigma factor RsiW
MTDCPNGLIRDQLPEYVHGVLSADAAALVGAHLAECAECRAEVALLGTVRAALSQGTPVMDVAAIVAAVVAAAPHRTARRAPRRFAVSTVWQFAAAAALVLAVGSTALWRGAPEQMVSRVADPSGAVVVPGSTAAVPADTPASVQSEVGMTFGGGLSDLSLNDLEALLGQMDSVRTLPSSNPESMTPVITVKEGGKSL